MQINAFSMNPVAVPKHFLKFIHSVSGSDNENKTSLSLSRVDVK
jgi:hypothetical protein